MVLIQCDNCNKMFNKKHYAIINSKHHFCGRKCWKLGRIVSDETRKKISEYRKGRIGTKHTEEYKKMMSELNKGKILSEETKQKIREKRKLQIITEATKIKMRMNMKKRYENPEERIKQSKRLKGKVMPPFSKEHRRKISESRLGEKNPGWNGGKSFEPYSINWTETLRRSIRERDHYTCRYCNKVQGDKVLAVHHIDYDKNNCNPNNLISLCQTPCHIKTNYNREQWKEYFIKNISKFNTLGFFQEKKNVIGGFDK